MPVTEVSGSHASIVVDTRKIGGNSGRIKKFISNFATVEEEMRYYKESGTSSNKHISHGQVYNQVHGTSAKITVLYKKNNWNEVHCDHSNSYSKGCSIPCATLSWRDPSGAHCFLLILFSPPFRKKSNKVWLVEKRMLIRRWTKRTEVESLSRMEVVHWQQFFNRVLTLTLISWYFC